MSVFINVVSQKMYITSTLDDIVAGSQEFVKFKFNFTKEWDELTIFAQFTQDGNPYNTYLDEENSVYLPPEIGAGTCTLMLYGTKDTTIGTTNYITLHINENILISDASSTDISESLYNQLVAKVDELSKQFSDLAGGEVVDKLIENKDIINKFIDNAIDDKTIMDYVDEKVSVPVVQNPKLWELEKGWYYIDSGFYYSELPSLEECYQELVPEGIAYIYQGIDCNYYIWDKTGYRLFGSVTQSDDGYDGYCKKQIMKSVIDENSTDEEFPTTKAVYNFVDSQKSIKSVSNPNIWELDFGLYRVSDGCYYSTESINNDGISDPVNPGQSTDRYIALRNESLLFVYSPAAIEINSGHICKFTIIEGDTIYTGYITDGNPITQYIGSISVNEQISEKSQVQIITWEADD